MTPVPPAGVTSLLLSWGRGDPDAIERLAPLVYGELRRLARRELRGERAAHTLQPTALVHEAYLRLVGQRGVSWQNRAHFFAVASRVMRRILVDHARSRNAAKRGSGGRTVCLAEAGPLGQQRPADLIALDDALTGLAAIDPRQSRIVELRFFGGLTVEEAAHVTGLSPRTIKREWRMAKAWLGREIQGGQRQSL